MFVVGDNAFSCHYHYHTSVSKRVKSGVKKILKRNQPITNFQSVVATPPRRRTISPAPPKEEEEETLPSNAEDSPYESIDGTQTTGENHL